jgi:uncharacterized membrane protein YhaH (DUF805 family)
MRGLAVPIGHHLRRLGQFSGRDARTQFWPYAGPVLALTFVSTGAAIVPFLFETMNRMLRFAVAHPDQSTVSVGPGQISISVRGNHPELMPDLSSVTAAFAVILLVAVLLLGGAVARRLHDRDRRGFWGVLPLPFLICGLALTPRVFAAIGNDDGSGLPIFFALFFKNLLYLGSVTLLAVLLAGAGKPGPNRFGPPPEALR